MRNPDWTRDELILALDLYFRHGRRQLDASHPDVVELSGLLNKLPVHDSASRSTEFRNPNGVAMKLGNFSRFDPAYAGKGLERGNRLEEEVWDEFASDPYRLKAVAQHIKQEVGSSAVRERPKGYDEEGQEEEFPEGKLLTRLHLARERNPKVVRRKKQQVLETTGALACECCGFDFKRTYGELGAGFAECHHTVPISQLTERAVTKLSDLAVVCANCHRMLHRSRPLLSVSQLRALVHGHP